MRMDQTQVQSSANAARSAVNGDPLLAVRDLSVAFNDGSEWFEVLNKVSLDVKPREIVGIVGESGCGK